jgi:hypothetical protein
MSSGKGKQARFFLPPNTFRLTPNTSRLTPNSRRPNPGQCLCAAYYFPSVATTSVIQQKTVRESSLHPCLAKHNRRYIPENFEIPVPLRRGITEGQMQHLKLHRELCIRVGFLEPDPINCAELHIPQ